MSTDQLLHNALSDMADAADKIHPNGGDHIRKLADEKYPHVHDFKRVPDYERSDTLRFCATMFRCEECGESYTC